MLYLWTVSKRLAAIACLIMLLQRVVSQIGTAPGTKSGVLLGMYTWTSDRRMSLSHASTPMP